MLRMLDKHFEKEFEDAMDSLLDLHFTGDEGKVSKSAILEYLEDDPDS